MDHQLQAVVQGVPTLPCLLPFIMGCLVKNTRAAPVAQMYTGAGEPAILPRDTVNLPLVARLFINTENDGPLAGVPAQIEARSDENVNPTVPDLVNTAAQTVPTLTVEERPGSAQVLPTDVAGLQEDANPINTVAESIPTALPVDGGSAGSLPTPTVDGGSAGSLPTPTVDGGSAGSLPAPTVDGGSAGLLPTPTVDGGSAGSLPTPTVDGGSARSLPPSPTVDGGSARSLPTDKVDGGSAGSLPTFTADGGSARSLPTDTPKGDDEVEAVSIDGTSARAVPTDVPSPEDDEISKTEGTSARSVPTDAAIAPAVAQKSADQSDSDDTVGNNGGKLRARDSGMTLSSVYLLLG